jgi:hypothetical protein
LFFQGPQGRRSADDVNRRITLENLVENPETFNGSTEEVSYLYLDNPSEIRQPETYCHICHRESTSWYKLQLNTPPMSERGGERDKRFGDMSKREDPDLKGNEL